MANSSSSHFWEVWRPLYFLPSDSMSGEGMELHRGCTRFGEHNFFATVGEAVSTYLASHPVQWEDCKS